MDLLTHALSGLASGTVIATCSKDNLLKKTGILFSGTLGGAFPDIDAISMWSGFDSTFGQLFHLSHSGRDIYGAKFWYSHHAFFHSLFASILLSLIFGVISYLVIKITSKRKQTDFIPFFRSNILICIAFISGYIVHLLGDMPTPSSVWGGVNFFWPSGNYIGGTGQIWWWNNYDIFLIISATCLLNLIILIIANFKKYNSKLFSTIVIIVASIFTMIQINTRKVDYSYTGNTPHFKEMELQSKEEQKRILGNKIYYLMEILDNKMKINF